MLGGYTWGLVFSMAILKSKEYQEVLETIGNKAFEHFKKQSPEAYVFHNYQHALATVEACQSIVKHYELSEEETFALLVAAWCLYLGISDDYQRPIDQSISYTRDWLVENNVPETLIEDITAIMTAVQSKQPDSLIAEILCDADSIFLGKKDFFHKSQLLRLEKERILQKNFTNPEWEQVQLDLLISSQFHTRYVASKYGPRKEKNINKQRKLVEDSGRKRTKKKADKIKSRKLGRGIETMYRSTYRNHINLSSIADAKANMMISLNTIIMSVIITIVGSGFAFSDGWFQSMRFTVPITILMVSSLIAVIFAVISAKPDVTKKEVDIDQIKDKKSSLLFFGNFSKLALGSFVSNMHELKQDRDLLYDNMSIDIYYLGKVLSKKYRLLRYSYTIFITGLTLAVVSFLGILIYTGNY